MTDEEIHQKYMRVAIKEARQAQLLGEVPIGAVVVHDDQIIGRGHNMREKFQDVTYHAEMLAIMEACTTLGSWRLEDCDLYVTLEPCIMCSGAIVNARIKNVYYGAQDPKAGAVDSLYHLLNDQRLNHQVHVESGILGAECGQMLKDFFRAIRKKRKLARKKRRAKG
ncbi:MAG TPA: tRNA adenosine(34) deaminase TadA [Candidatus Limosilactobacillus intestinigallinarum]|nr:tRNA adenosine(34) deaminase TadA [Candidatus Limosilactobacillus intestinigallinarum]